jgi:hypothetical protein
VVHVSVGACAAGEHEQLFVDDGALTAEHLVLIVVRVLAAAHALDQTGVLCRNRDQTLLQHIVWSVPTERRLIMSNKIKIFQVAIRERYR